MNLAIKTRDYGQFFNKYPNSPIAILFLKTLAKYSFNGLPLFSIQECKSAYDKLSDELKNSDEGKELWGIISK